MKIPQELVDRQFEHAEWRHHLHAHPEIAFEEKHTSEFVAARLQEFGLRVHRGLAGQGSSGR